MIAPFRFTVVIILCVVTTTAGCATAGTTPVSAAAISDQGSTSRRILAEYVQKLPVGTEVRVARSSGHSLRGTLIKGTDQSIFIQPKTRIPEPLVEIPLSDVLQVVPERRGGGSNIGRAIGAGAAAGAAATLAIFLVLFAVAGD